MDGSVLGLASTDSELGEALAAHGLAMVRDDASGRGVVAARSFEAGAVLLRCSPAASVLSSAASETHCHHSLVASEKLKRCSSCGYARYSSMDNQRAAWPAHRSECAMLKRTRPNVPGATMLLCARLLDLAYKDSASTPSAGLASGMRGVRSLSSQLNASSAERRAEYAHQAAMLCGLISEALPDRTPSVDMAADLLSVLSCNGHTVCNEELEPIGLGIYPLAALTNHDCDPSAAQSFEGGQLVLRALRPIATGDAITIGYVDLAASAAARRAELRRGYLFECTCARCEADAPRETELARAFGKLASARAATLAAIDASSWPEALSMARRSTELASSLLPEMTPALGIEWLRFAKLLAHQGSLDEAIDAYQRAHRILRVTHGPSAPLVRSLEEDLRAYEAERGASAR